MTEQICTACVREEAIERLLKNPTNENRAAVWKLVTVEQGFIISNAALTKGSLCSRHGKDWASYEKYVLYVNSAPVRAALFGTESDKVLVQ